MMDEFDLYHKRCRLCASEHRLGLNLFGKEGVSLDLKSKIKMYLSIDVSLEDELPKEVCYQCLYRIETFHNFKQSCMESEHTLRNWHLFYGGIASRNKPSYMDCESNSLPEVSDSSKLSVESVAQPTRSSISEITEKAMKDKRYKLQPNVGVTNKIKMAEEKKQLSNSDGKIDIVAVKNRRNVVKICDNNRKEVVSDNSEVSRILLNMSGVGTIAVTKFQGVKAKENSVENSKVDDQEDGEIEPPLECVIDSDDDGESDGFSGFDLSRRPEGPDVEELKDESLYMTELVPKECIEFEHFEVDDYNAVSLTKEETEDDSSIQVAKSEDSLECMMFTTVEDSGMTRYACMKCDKTYAQKSYMKEHMKIHTGEKPFSCSVCNRSFRNNYMLKVHYRLHTGEKNFKCEECEAVFTERGALVSHSRTHTGDKPFLCKYCGRTFAQNPALKRHIRIHTKERPYMCDHCDASFADRGTWRNHVRTHTGERPYDCRLCGKSFVQRTNLQAHIRTHTDERPFACRVCGSSFRAKAHLVKHLSTVHKDVMKSVITFHRGIERKNNIAKVEPAT